MGFGKVNTLALSFSHSLEVEDDYLSKMMEILNSYGGLYKVPILRLSDLSPLRLGPLNLAQNGFN